MSTGKKASVDKKARRGADSKALQAGHLRLQLLLTHAFHVAFELWQVEAKLLRQCVEIVAVAMVPARFFRIVGLGPLGIKIASLEYICPNQVVHLDKLALLIGRTCCQCRRGRNQGMHDKRFVNNAQRRTVLGLQLLHGFA